MRVWCLAALAAAIAAASGGASAQEGALAPPPGTERGSVAHLALLCVPPANAPDRPVAMALCHGFLLGAGQYYAALHHEGSRRRRPFCPPSPPPSLGEAGAAFAAWAGAHPETARERAIEGVMRWAVATWPCPRQPARPSRRR